MCKKGFFSTDKSMVRSALSWLTSPQSVQLLGEPFFRLLGLRRKVYEHDFIEIKHVLVVRLDEIGDIVLTIPLLRELRRNLPDAWISLVVNPSIHNLVELCPYINEILIYDWDTKGFCKSLKLQGRTLKFCFKFLWHRRFDLGILPRWDADLYNATYLLYLSGARKRVGYSESVTEKKAHFNQGVDLLLTQVFRDSVEMHEVERNLNILKLLGGEVAEKKLELWIGKEDEFFADEILESGSVNSSDLLIGMGVGAKSPKRLWPLMRFVEIAIWLYEVYQAKFIIFGGSEEEKLGETMHKKLGMSVLNMVGRSTLRQTAALLWRCHLFLGNDSGPMHIAAAMSVPIVEISCHPLQGLTNHHNSPARFGPWGVPHIVLQPNAIPPCADACLSTQAHCIAGISVDQVKQAVLSHLHSHKAVL